MGLRKLLKLADEDNAKAHDTAGLEESFERFGFTEPLTLNEHTGKLLAGHGRTETAEQMRAAGKKPPVGVKVKGKEWLLPVLRGVSLTDPDEIRAYLFAVNKLVESGGWSLPKLSSVLAGMLDRKVKLTGTGFGQREAQRIVSRGVRVKPREVPIPDKPKSSRVKPGEVWVLGDQRLACGDCRDRSLLERLFGGARADLLMADPPYGMDKGFEGDNQKAAKLDAFQTEWWEAARPSLAPNASCYVWGNAEDLWRWWFGSLLPWNEQRDLAVTFRNELVWDKGYGNGQGTEAIRSYPMFTERALFFAIGKQGFGNKNSDRYWTGWDELRLPLIAEADAAGLTAKRVKEITGVQMHAHWFGQSQWVFIPEQHYRALAEATGRFKAPHAELAKVYEKLRVRFDQWLQHERAFFDATHDPKLGEVWSYPKVEAGERYGHPTVTPVEMAVRIARTSAAVGALIFEPFGGTGPMLLAAEQTGRRCCTVELDPIFCEVIASRWEALTGRKAVRLESITAE